MSYPTYRQDFENNTTVPPELWDSAGVFVIDSGGTWAFTGNRSIKSTVGVGNNVLSFNGDSLSGQITTSAYFKLAGQGLISPTLHGRTSLTLSGLYNAYNFSLGSSGPLIQNRVSG